MEYTYIDDGNIDTITILTSRLPCLISCSFCSPPAHKDMLFAERNVWLVSSIPPPVINCSWRSVKNLRERTVEHWIVMCECVCECVCAYEALFAHVRM